MKLKSTFSGVENVREKRNSVFYPEMSPNQEELDDLGDSDSDENTVIDNQSVIDLSVSPSRLKETEREGVVGELEMSPTEDSCELFQVGSLEGYNRKFGTNRPINLDLVDESGNPIPPPRHVKKKNREKRDQRLLSVPNIKFQKAELQSYKDLRDKEDVIVSPQPSFSTNLKRRFSKF